MATEVELISKLDATETKLGWHKGQLIQACVPPMLHSSRNATRGSTRVTRCAGM
jgi:hypothetical protein